MGVNSYYNVSGNPLQRSQNKSALIRAEFSSLEDAMSMLPDPLGGGVRGFNGGTFQSPTITNPLVQGGTFGQDVVGSTALVVFSTVMASIQSPGVAANFGSTGGIRSWLSSASPARSGIAVVGNQLDRFMVSDAGDVIVGDSVNPLSTSATAGFLWLPRCAGAPSGTPAASYAGAVPMVYDTTNDQICVYRSGWKKTAALT